MEQAEAGVFPIEQSVLPDLLRAALHGHAMQPQKHWHAWCWAGLLGWTGHRITLGIVPTFGFVDKAQPCMCESFSRLLALQARLKHLLA